MAWGFFKNEKQKDAETLNQNTESSYFDLSSGLLRILNLCAENITNFDWNKLNQNEGDEKETTASYQGLALNNLPLNRDNGNNA